MPKNKQYHCGSSSWLAVGSLAWAAVLGSGPAAGAESPRPQPALTDVALFCALSPSSLVVRGYPSARVPCLERYLAGWKALQTGAPRQAPCDPGPDLSCRRGRLAEQIVLLLGKSVTKEAQAFAQEVPLTLEWEGLSENPLVEADFTRQWLAHSPTNPIAPFLHLFMAHRFRAAFEAARAAVPLEKGLLPSTEKRYREHLKKAREGKKPLLTCVADDLEGLPHVYLPAPVWP